MSRKGEDPMSGLLSSVGGIDSSLFQRPQSMKDMRSNQAPPVQKDPAPSAPKPQQAALSTQPTASSSYGFAYKGSQPSTANHVSPRPGPASQSSSRAGFSSQSNESTNSQLDALLGGSVIAKKGRPMREASKTGCLNVQGSQTGQPPQPLQRYEAASPPRAPTVSSPPQVAVVHDDLDNVFGPGKSFSSQQSKPRAAGADDPFALFGGLGITEQHKSVSQPPSAEDDILGGLSSSLGLAGSPPSYPQQHQRSALGEADLQDDGLSARPSPPSSVQSRRSFRSTAGSGDWGGLVGAQSSGFVSPLAGAAPPEDVFDVEVASPTATSPSAARARDDFGRLSSPERLQTSGSQPQRASTAAPQQPQPPSYEAVMRASKGPVSPRAHLRGHHGSGKYQAYKDEDSGDTTTSAQQPSSFSKRHAPRRSSSSSAERMAQQVAPDRRAQPEHGQADMKDQAKQWLSAGQKWLSSAGKKVAQAVKETQTQINLKLEELEGHGPQSNGAPRSQQHLARQKSRSDSSSSLSDIPTYYFEWAETIQALPAHEQGATLAAMPDDDATTIQRILRHRAAKRASFEETESAIMAEAQRRSLSEQRLQQRASRNLSPTNARTLRSHSSELTSNSSGLASPPPDRRAPIRTEPEMPERVARMPEGRQPSLPPQPQQQADASADFIGLHHEAQQPRPQPVPAPSHPSDGTDDLMGLHGQPSQPKAAPPTAQPAEHDILGLSHTAAPPQPNPQSSRAAATGLEQMFSAPAPSRAASQRPEDIFAAEPPTKQPRAPQAGGAPDSMIDFGDNVGLSLQEGVYQPGRRDVNQEGEPEARKVARRKRIAETQARMQRQLAEKQARDRADLQKQEAQHDLRRVHEEHIAAWKSGKKDNIRALLATLHTVLWENSGWTAPGMTDLVEPGRVKRSYMKANLVVHPDKVKQKGGTVEQIVIADMAFDTLKTAWSKFEASELRGR